MAVKEKNLNDLAPYYFHQGTNYEAYKYLGCHLEENDGRLTYIFRTWAPNAARVSVIADFNSWNSWDMQRVTEGGIWELKY
ncbi:MAG: 1,4-alpha-glucan branching enzyme, partial [Clostridia bacterium]|nr:1,4-alpha-glucan branching enzyme [Clostridia bacterium]